VVKLQSDVFDLVRLESHQIFLASYEKGKRYVEQDGLDLGLDQLSGMLELHAHRQEFD
jgi:hypothetical protein